VDFPDSRKVLYLPGWAHTGLQIVGFKIPSDTSQLAKKLPKLCHVRVNHLTSLLKIQEIQDSKKITYKFPPNYSWQDCI
jgi:hypothetical protein